MTPCPGPQTPGPWHVVADEPSGAWLCAPDGLPVGYFEHAADAHFVVGLVQGALAAQTVEAPPLEER